MSVENESTASAEFSDSLESIAQAMSESSTEAQDADDEEIEGEEAPEQEDESEEEADAESEEEPEDDDPEIDLGDIKVKKSELKAGYMKDADYRQKTAAVAESKRQAEAIAAQAQAEREYYANHLDVTLGRLQAQIVGDQAELARLAKEDPAAWVAANQQFQERVADYQTALADRQAIAQRQQVEEQAAQREYVREQQSILQEKLPEWRDPQVKAKEAQGIADFLLARGYSTEDLGSLQDARALLIVRDAWLATQQAKARETAQAKQSKPQPGAVIKPGAPKAIKPNLALKEANARLQRDPNSLEALGAFVHASRNR